MVFPNGGPVPRHPSQLYESFAEGLLLFLLLWWLAYFTRALQRPGLTAGVFLTGYAVARTICELFRQPDVQLGFIVGGVTMGQILCVPLAMVGLWLIWRAAAAPVIASEPVPPAARGCNGCASMTMLLAASRSGCSSGGWPIS
jgi:phosphatidylglycerol:prolipoprotein diacylglycerol transferase